jgi:hypothetical protein
MHRGKWHDRQLLPARYFDDLMRPQTPKNLPVSAPAETDDYLKIGTYGGGSEHFTQFGAGIYGGNWWFNLTGKLHPDQPTWPDAPPDTIMSIGARGNNSVLMPGLNLVVAAANADWGKLEAGVRDSVLNQRLKLIAWAGSSPGPVPKGTSNSRNARSPADRDAAANARGVAIEGDLRQWHRVSLVFRGPQTDEAAVPNPFTDYRLNVTFTNGPRTYVVPGHFAADGRAADSSATGGNCWRVHFAPDSAGAWKWTASFREGADVAVSDDPAAGRPGALNGLSGEFDVQPTDKLAPDFRSKGLLRYVGRRYLQFAGTGEWFLKGGADSPENVLAYYEFDDTKPTHRFGPHALDFREGDPVWQGGKGRQLIGAINYLAERGVNAMYLMTLNVQGDGKDVWPWTSDTQRLRFDCSKLDQWEIVFSHMDRMGLMQHIVLQEQENDQLLDGGELGRERRLYFRELISRFSHHPAVTWNLGEENTNTLDQRRDFARYFHEHDPYRHMVVIHTFPKQIEEVYRGLLGYEHVDGASLQTNDTHQKTKEWINRSAAAGRQWVICGAICWRAERALNGCSDTAFRITTSTWRISAAATRCGGRRPMHWSSFAATFPSRR